MPLTAKQRAERHKYIGASDMAAIMGFSRFATAYDVFLEKTQRIVAEDDPKDWQTAGQRFEPGVLDWFSRTINLGKVTQKNLERIVKDIEVPIKVHPDAILEGTNEPIEAKTEGLYGPILEPWGDEGTDEVPEHVCIQAHCQMMALDVDLCHVPTFLGGRGFGYFFVRKDIKLMRLIREQAVHFWENHVLKNVPPEECAPRLENIKKIRRIEGEPVKLNNELVKEFILAKEACSRAEAYKNEMQAKVLAVLDGNEIGESEDYYITNFRQSKTYLNQKKLTEMHPEIAKTFMKITSFPVMRHREKA